MGGKVIKINLVGAIFTVLIIIAAIVGIVIFATRDTRDDGKENKKDNKQNTIQDDKELYNELNKKETVSINGTTKEITMKTYEKKLEYRIDYDIDTFYINELTANDVLIESLVSDSIMIRIKKKNDFKVLVNDLSTNEVNKKNTYEKYKLSSKVYHGHLGYIEYFESGDSVRKTYYIENGDEYYLIEVICGKEYKDNILPIIDKMVDSFKIM